MSWFFLGDVPHTRRRGIVMRRRELREGNSGLLAKAIHASDHHDPEMELMEVRVADSNAKTVTFEVWEKDWETPLDDVCYSVFYIRVPVTKELLEQVCEGDYGRGTKRNWSKD